MIREGREIWSFILDCVFPQSCLGCDEDDLFLCTACRGCLVNPGLVFESIGFLNSLVSLAEYSAGSVSGKLIEAVKYNYSIQGFTEITNWVEQNPSLIMSLNVDLVIPIPLHPRREAERGFNQAEIIARPVAKILTKPLAKTVLRRTKATKQQARLSKTERLKNVDQAFVVTKPHLVKEKTCLLVDDVYTTGSTMQSAAKALVSAGAQKVLGFTLARAVSN